MNGRNCSCILRNGMAVSTPARVASAATPNSCTPSGPPSNRPLRCGGFNSPRCAAASRIDFWSGLLHSPASTRSAEGGKAGLQPAVPVGRPGPSLYFSQRGQAAASLEYRYKSPKRQKRWQVTALSQCLDPELASLLSREGPVSAGYELPNDIRPDGGDVHLTPRFSCRAGNSFPPNMEQTSLT